MEMTPQLKKQIIAYAKQFTGSNVIHFHQFANRLGHMLVIETRNVEGFTHFLNWMAAEVERSDIEVIRTLPEENGRFNEFENRTLAFFIGAHTDFHIATEINDGRISHMKKDDEQEGEYYAI